MTLQQIQGFDLAGFSVRTTNLAEQDDTTAKIGHLWQRFFSEAAPHLSADSRIYGVYTHYQSDFNGEFDVMACSDTLSGDDTNLVSLHIATGDYLVFSAQGEMPNVVIELWQQVWGYFSDPQYAYQRAYKTDFEYYKSAQEVEIYIGVTL
ncbi:AraC family transcriptional regulator [Vibrio sp. JPW-9-11-11]|uniref:GyrI-like domain-containing protein n=1 Tax=Vibrio sp. JPW-9-11-11 TaxID=1416532 RepID=UPI001592B64B|nr:GyrI-like domain-containing protein [Vibrio sp. JPW-9-11-11]NVD06493.1 AraC family transcriptional regulator [Vibrio sp. JPW-9-11-11]